MTDKTNDDIDWGSMLDALTSDSSDDDARFDPMVCTEHQSREFPALNDSENTLSSRMLQMMVFNRGNVSKSGKNDETKNHDSGSNGNDNQ